MTFATTLKKVASTVASSSHQLGTIIAQNDGCQGDMLLKNSAQTSKNKSADEPMNDRIKQIGLCKHLNRTSNICQTSCNDAFKLQRRFGHFLGHRNSVHKRSLNWCRFGSAFTIDHTSVQLPFTIHVSSIRFTTSAIHASSKQKLVGSNNHDDESTHPGCCASALDVETTRSGTELTVNRSDRWRS